MLDVLLECSKVRLHEVIVVLELCQCAIRKETDLFHILPLLLVVALQVLDGKLDVQELLVKAIQTWRAPAALDRRDALVEVVELWEPILHRGVEGLGQLRDRRAVGLLLLLDILDVPLDAFDVPAEVVQVLVHLVVRRVQLEEVLVDLGVQAHLFVVPCFVRALHEVDLCDEVPDGLIQVVEVLREVPRVLVQSLKPLLCILGVL